MNAPDLFMLAGELLSQNLLLEEALYKHHSSLADLYYQG